MNSCGNFQIKTEKSRKMIPPYPWNSDIRIKKSEEFFERLSILKFG